MKSTIFSLKKSVPLVALFGLLQIALLTGCKKTDSTVTPSQTNDIVFATSFEADADTSGWIGYGGHTLSQDVPASGGKRSMLVSGGCIIPHAQKFFLNTGPARSVSLSFWGKLLEGSGVVSLALRSKPSSGISLGVHDSVWTQYVSQGKLTIAEGDTLCIVMISGGYVPGAMLIDRIEIK
jgi:hypothetical protein